MNTTTVEQIVQFLQIISQKRLPAEKMQRLLDEGYLADLLEAQSLPDRNVFQQLLKVGFSPAVVRQLPSYVPGPNLTRSLLLERGNYSYVDPETKEMGFRHHVGSQHPVLARLSRAVSTEEGERTLLSLRRDFDLAELRDLLWIGGAPKSDVTRADFPVIAFGSVKVVGNKQMYPCIRYSEQDEKSLVLIERSECMQMIANQVKFLLVVK